VPTEQVVEVRRAARSTRSASFSPLCAGEMRPHDQVFSLIKNTPKVTGFLGADNKPMPISEDEAAASRPGGEGVERPRRQFPSRSARRCASPTAICLIQRRRRGSRRGSFAAQGGRVDLWPRHTVELEFGQWRKYSENSERLAAPFEQCGGRPFKRHEGKRRTTRLQPVIFGSARNGPCPTG